jgi:putative FmdB family regulatory protein
MPTYVYECSSCNKTFEIEQRITEDPLKDCHCGSSGTVKRLIQPTAVMFKGAGFHINDYSSSKPAESAAEAAPAKTESAPACTGEPASCPSCAPAADA